ncbi:MAG: phosphoribosylaminoimidazolesuccinocarboxamide synthase [Patescibacteria group bacterium]
MNKIPEYVREKIIVKSLASQLVYQGKVRDTYSINDGLLLMVATDRISIFDFVLNACIPYKGEILTALTHFWLTQVLQKFPNHLVGAKKIKERNFAVDLSLSVPDLPLGRSLVVKKMEIPPYELVFRQHLGGSAYAEYKKTGKVAGKRLPRGLRKWMYMPSMLFTPSTKEKSGHDQNIAVKKFFKRTGDTGRTSVEMFTKVYRRAYRFALSKGLVILDTKFEGGTIIADEVLTPDSSRFTSVEDLARALKENRDPKFYDKENVRRWGGTVYTPFKKRGEEIIGINNLDPKNPEHVEFVHRLRVPFSVIMRTSMAYQKLFEKISGITLQEYQRKFLF